MHVLMLTHQELPFNGCTFDLIFSHKPILQLPTNTSLPHGTERVRSRDRHVQEVWVSA